MEYFETFTERGKGLKIGEEKQKSKLVDFGDLVRLGQIAWENVGWKTCEEKDERGEKSHKTERGKGTEREKKDLHKQK